MIFYNNTTYILRHIFAALGIFILTGCTGWPLLNHALQLQKTEKKDMNPLLLLLLQNRGSSSSGTSTSSSLTAPTLLTASGSSGKVSLTWSSVTGASSYTVYYSTSSSVTVSSASVTAGNVTAYTVQSLTNGTLYYFAVKAASASASSALSNILSATPSSGASVQCLSQGYCNTFVASAGYNGNLGGLSGADAICSGAKPGGLPGTGTDYKAMLVVVGSRDYPSTNWVLYANMQYRQADAVTVIGTTDANANFTTALTNPINPGGAAAAVWSGWDKTNTCTGWTSTAGNGDQGACCGLTAIPAAVDTGSTACSNSRSLVCVQQ
ncbi:MAG TPA: DUF1554 domain-containing protein [Leptospiraceae bacterium]|nr:DUF1554 domain-containing protein [Leptospiraceae bacterium]HMZ57305.1 DUF1554 domain-containing protein [Leptospiraceae bacterium]